MANNIGLMHYAKKEAFILLISLHKVPWNKYAFESEVTTKIWP